MSNRVQIKPLLIATLESALNRYLQLDPHLSQLLAPLAGKTIAIHITPFAETLYLCPNGNNIVIVDSYTGAIDAELTGSLMALGFMGISSNPMHTLFKGEVQIAGNTDVARHFQQLFAKLDINLQAKLASITGEHFAEQVGQLLRNSRDWSLSSLHTLRLNIEEFLQEETRNLPAKPEAELFFQQVDVCRNDYDRLAARVQQLNSQLDNISSSENR